MTDYDYGYDSMTLTFTEWLMTHDNTKDNSNSNM